VKLEQAAASDAVAMYLGILPGAKVFHSIIVHIDDEVPVQLEDRFINPAMAPEYLAQDFSRSTPNAYLSRVAPIEAVEHVIEAVLPTSLVARWLQVRSPEACLQINRRTWSRGHIVTFARLVHPGSRYRLGGYVPVAHGSASQRRNRA
jgi:GntR family histidine utilization transcriptional repressor